MPEIYNGEDELFCGVGADNEPQLVGPFVPSKKNRMVCIHPGCQDASCGTVQPTGARPKFRLPGLAPATDSCYNPNAYPDDILAKSSLSRVVSGNRDHEALLARTAIGSDPESSVAVYHTNNETNNIGWESGAREGSREGASDERVSSSPVLGVSLLEPRKVMAFFLALCDFLGSLDGSTNLFIAIFRECPEKKVKVIGNNRIYRVFVFSACSLLAFFDAVVHYFQYSNPIFNPQLASGSIADHVAANDGRGVSGVLEKKILFLSPKTLAFWCSFACSLEVVGVPLAALAIIKDNYSFLNNKSSRCYVSALVLTGVSSVINVLNGSVMYQLSRDNLTRNTSVSKESDASSPSKNFLMLKSGSRAFFNASASVIENTNFIFKLYQAVGSLVGRRDIALPVWIKYVAPSLFGGLAISVAVSRYYMYQYYNRDDSPVKTGISGVTCLDSDANKLAVSPSSMRGHDLGDRLMDSDSLGQMHAKPNQGSMLAQIDRTPDAHSQDKGQLSERGAKVVASLCTLSTMFGRMAVPYSALVLFQSSGLIDQQEGWRDAAFVFTVCFGLGAIITRGVVYDVTIFHLKRKQTNESCNDLQCNCHNC